MPCRYAIFEELFPDSSNTTSKSNGKTTRPTQGQDTSKATSSSSSSSSSPSPSTSTSNTTTTTPPPEPKTISVTELGGEPEADTTETENNRKLAKAGRFGAPGDSWRTTLVKFYRSLPKDEFVAYYIYLALKKGVTFSARLSAIVKDAPPNLPRDRVLPPVLQAHLDELAERQIMAQRAENSA
ncbi:hypothetical protein F5B22DRAFT_640862 [Xylaria bambusicola]|uniref:uncharacterized protein n=1 Tax=Xylaria bambusicola TaxID=326684 RepID=UPI002007BD0B|nr:uncharacterized protein F5B22DRAFT_640862 [Xylaria bambusicola]KAI0527885.1 hypothetical protein F5B22DRAFT_640862 [Xylaria bambusicola]